MAILVIIQSRSRRHIYAKSCARYNLKFVKMELEKSLPGKAETTFVQNSEEDEEQEEEEEEPIFVGTLVAEVQGEAPCFVYHSDPA